MSDAELQVGFFGKVPQLGDFVERRIHPEFRTLWDQWLQECLTASRDGLGDAWLDKYLVSPIWSFALSPGVCGQAVYAGVLVPSVDRVGRYFPLAIVATLGPETPCLALLTEGGAWFRAASTLLLNVLEGRLTDIDELDRLVCELERPLAELTARLAPRTGLQVDMDLVLPLESEERLSQSFAVLIEPLLTGRVASPTFWLTEGSADLSARLLIAHGLPQPTAFAAMLGGGFDPARWQTVSYITPAAGQAWSLVSSMRTDRGHVRRQNEDYAASRPDLKLWVVADGMGGYQDGALASAAVCDALQVIGWRGSLREKVDLCITRLRSLNAEMRIESQARDQNISSASTVVALLIDSDQWACVWAGDSRLYRYRGAHLEQLSHDHSVGARDGDAANGEEYFVTAGVGVEDELMVDVLYGDVQPGDRFLLCSDGLYTDIGESTIISGLSNSEPRVATNELMRAALEGTARDNVTAVAVYVNDTHMAIEDVVP
jgi:type VI secretion system protein ImpM